MAARECGKCDRRYPSVVSATACPACGGALSFAANKEANVNKEEYDLLRWIKGLKIPGTLSADELLRIEREWDVLEAEAKRRGDRWSVADVLGDSSFRPLAA